MGDTRLTVKVPLYEEILPAEQATTFLEELNKSPALWLYTIVQALARPTPEEFIRKREGPKQSMLTYVEGSYALATLAALSKLGVMSSFEVVQTDSSTEAVECLGKLTLGFLVGGVWSECVRMQWGSCLRQSGVALGSTKKGAATDSIKKCLSGFGWALDVYTTEAEWNPPPSKEEMKSSQIETYYDRAKQKGWTRQQALEYCVKETGKKPEEADTKDLAALKRRLMNV